MTMTIELTTSEIALLLELLRQRTSDLRVEIRRTDNRQYHDDLRKLEQELLSLTGRLDRAQEPASSPPPQ
jgi:hypothetical protein